MPPELDPQTNGFGNFELISDADAPGYKVIWQQVFSYLWDDSPAEAQTLLDISGFPFEVVYFTDTETGTTFRMLRELLNEAYVDTGFYAGPEDDVVGSFDKGWGLFIINPDASIPWAQIQVTHINDDFIAVPMVTDIFLRGDLGALAFHGTGREVQWQEGEDYNNGRSLSDPSRNGKLPFQWFTEFFVDQVRSEGQRDITIQIHSYDSESHEAEATVQISGGSTDGYPNRPARDISGLGYDWVNFAPTVVVPADYSLFGQAEVLVQNMFAVWRGYGLTHLASGVDISTHVELSGYGNSPQMATASQGYNRYEAFDRWLHVEFDELPNPIEAAGYSELVFFNGTIPPTESNWDALLRYYEAASDALIAYLDDVENPADIDPPTTPAGLDVFYAADDFVELTWNESSLDPNFATYEVYYDTSETIGLEDSVWTFENEGNLVGQNIQFSHLSGLEFGLDYGFRLRGVDRFGNAGEFSDRTVRAFTQEGSNYPRPFSLLTPLDGDTCILLDTTFIWESTTDEDLYDVPHYDFWLDTLSDFSTAWMPEDADSLADTTFAVSNLKNRKTYYWTVRATDRNTPGTWANETNSLVTWKPFPPAPFELAEPMDRSTLFDAVTTTLRWNSTYSIDYPDDEINYILISAQDSDFTIESDTVNVADTSYVLDGLLMDQTYWWKVFAYDTRDTIQCEDVWKFYIWENDPPVFSLLTPDDGEFVGEDEVTVTWSTPEDIMTSGPQVQSPQVNVNNIHLNSLSQMMAVAPKGSNIGGGEGWAVIDDQGGPDDFGHVWIDNKEAGGPTYDWIEISEIGTLSTVSGIDDGVETVDIPFSFPYFEGEHSTVVISSNGNIHFGTPDNDFHHYTIPSPDGPAGIIAPWWIDLRPNEGGDIYYYGDDDIFVVQYDDCREYNNANWRYTFQVILYPTGRIKFQYKHMVGGLAHATIGIENLAENDGLLIAFNALYVADRIAISFDFEDWLYEVEWSADEEFQGSSSAYTFENEYLITDVDLIQLLTLDELDELPDNTTIFWRCNTMNLFGQKMWATPGASGRSFMVYLQEPPFTFEMLSPFDGAVVENDSVTVSWETAIDPDPLDIISYYVEWSANPDLTPPRYSATVEDTFYTITDLDQPGLLSPPVISGTKVPNDIAPVKMSNSKRLNAGKGVESSKKQPLSGLSEERPKQPQPGNEIDELPDDATVYWRVRAQDQEMNRTWPAHGDSPWSFLVQVPEPPDQFTLFAPALNDTIDEANAHELPLVWEPSDDPDPGEEVRYTIEVQITIGETVDTTWIVYDIPDTTISVDLINISGIQEWDEFWEVNWQVQAISGTDTVVCEEPFCFYVAPFLSVDEGLFSGLPTEYSIARIFPNPFNASTQVVIGIPEPGMLNVTLYNVLGQRVATIHQADVVPGYHRLLFNASALSSGIYFVRATVPGQFEQVQRVVLVR
ncbi:fibronectin type III domain protein [bacterium BMS3Bbin04]|nr:fibronectin type III domain protein [bacterium BMS3Bbin04]